MSRLAGHGTAVGQGEVAEGLQLHSVLLRPEQHQSHSLYHLHHPQTAVHTPSHFAPHNNRPGTLTGLQLLLYICQMGKLRSSKASCPSSNTVSEQSTQSLELTSSGFCHFALALYRETMAWGCPEEFSSEKQAR